MRAARALAAAAASGALDAGAIDEAAFAAALRGAPLPPHPSRAGASHHGAAAAAGDDDNDDDDAADVALSDPDLIIRTSGEQRLSNFMLWQAAWSELAFVPMAWPDFREAHLAAALRDYAARTRRFGGHGAGAAGGGVR